MIRLYGQGENECNCFSGGTGVPACETCIFEIEALSVNDRPAKNRARHAVPLQNYFFWPVAILYGQGFDSGECHLLFSHRFTVVFIATAFLFLASERQIW